LALQNERSTFEHAMSHAGVDRLRTVHEALNFVLGLMAAPSISALVWGLIAVADCPERYPISRIWTMG
jgi:hypothetical protein